MRTSHEQSWALKHWVVLAGLLCQGHREPCKSVRLSLQNGEKMVYFLASEHAEGQVCVGCPWPLGGWLSLC